MRGVKSNIMTPLSCWGISIITQYLDLPSILPMHVAGCLLSEIKAEKLIKLIIK